MKRAKRPTLEQKKIISGQIRTIKKVLPPTKVNRTHTNTAM